MQLCMIDLFLGINQKSKNYSFEPSVTRTVNDDLIMTKIESKSHQIKLAFKDRYK